MLAGRIGFRALNGQIVQIAAPLWSPSFNWIKIGIGTLILAAALAIFRNVEPIKIISLLVGPAARA